jgi:phosphoglycolate phosphatase
MSSSFKLFMFDLDGTLIETAPEIADAVNDTLARFDLPAVPQACVDRWIGHGTHELLIQALAFAGKTTEPLVRASASLPLFSAEFGRHYQRRCGTNSRPYPHVREVLQQLRDRGTKLALVTNKEERYMRAVLDAHSLAPLFHRVIGGDSLPTKKPDPAGINACLDEFQVHRDHALFVGDSSIDVATARNAGVQVWALPYGYNMGQPIAACGPDRVIADFSALIETQNHLQTV